MSDMEYQPKNTPDALHESATVHSNNKQIQVQMGGMQFRAAITHTEKEGEHQVVVASAEADLPLLRLCAEPMMKLLTKQFGVPLDHLSYFERNADGALFQVNTKKIGDAQTPRGHWSDTSQVIGEQHPAGMPTVAPEIDLAQGGFPPTPDLRELARDEQRRKRFHRYKL